MELWPRNPFSIKKKKAINKQKSAQPSEFLTFTYELFKR